MKKFLLEEEIRILENHLLGSISVWDQWGPYVSERCWGTVRESNTPDPWVDFSHDRARKEPFRWGEDGIAGLCDRYQILTLNLALWNQKDPILKERLFGLTPHEGNHGEDVKEAYFYLDNLPSHAYMKYLYKYPIDPFPYDKLIQENKKRSKRDSEYEIFDTGIFNDEKYFDVFIEYAKLDPQDIFMRIEVFNRYKEAASIDVIPQLTFRNLWFNDKEKKPQLWKSKEQDGFSCIELDDYGIEPFPMLDVEYSIGHRYVYASPGADLLFTENVTGQRDAFHRAIVDKDPCILGKTAGTRAAFHYKNCTIEPGASKVFRLRLTKSDVPDPLSNADSFCGEKTAECQMYFDKIFTDKVSQEEKKIAKAAICSQLWSRQLYLLISNRNPPEGIQRNLQWGHLVSKHIITMPDKWEYPWFAAWDLAFHAITIALYDIDLAKDQLFLLLTEFFQHPNGQIPAYEWDFSDLNPPIQAWAVLKLFSMEQAKKGKGDKTFLKKCFHRLVINFTWWVNQVDEAGNNIFQGGFLGLDNIAIIDRSKPIPGGGTLEQSDGTGWMGFFCLQLFRMATELAKDDPAYEVMMIKFFQHFVYIAVSLSYSQARHIQNWDEEDGFFYDVLSLPDGSHQRIPVRSLVGIIPIYATEIFSLKELQAFPDFFDRYIWGWENKAYALENCVFHEVRNGEEYVTFSLASKDKLDRILEKVLSPDEFLSPFGLRSLSKAHEKNPVKLFDQEIQYDPGTSTLNMYGGNSNWRGPIWMPMNYLLIETLKKVGKNDLAKAFSEKIISLFKEQDGQKPIFRDYPIFQQDNWKDYFWFFEYFHGDTGAGLGASHQTGWSALIANLIQDLPEL